ncbi:hypothetical protein [Candidatus Marithrix sp. Canyon 246]|uniref:hypothetical protein n=1 Tax=Candidatus Marithrix sp. Canyon 246 TaxID=1827136 RepID=UPI00114D2E18|nr:hypothetical protein [Candidatus Marithrix sp. Canyon 246]
MRIFIAIILLTITTISLANTETEASESTHFIILIDDSKTLKTHTNRMIQSLPAILFDGVHKKQGVGSRLPTYKPKIDYISLVFFGINKKSSKQCQAQHSFSVLPEDLFYWQKVANRNFTKSRFRQFLKKTLKKPCRFKSFTAPVFTAESLIISSVQNQADLAFSASRTFVLLLSNERYKTEKSPRKELSSFLYKRMKDKQKVLKLIKPIRKTFNLRKSKNDIFTLRNSVRNRFLRGGRKENEHILGKAFPLTFRITEFDSPFQAELNSYIDMPKQVQLEPLAISSEKLRMIPVTESIITVKKSKALDHYKMEIKFIDDKGKLFPPEQSSLKTIIYFDKCKSCIKQSTGIQLPVFKEIRPELLTIPVESSIKLNSMLFQISFHETRDITKSNIIKTAWQKIKISDAPVFTIAANNIFPAMTLNNQQLVNQWIKSDVNGLTQTVAKKRIEATRVFWIQSIYILIIIIFIITIIYVLIYYTQYPFQPILKWNQKDDVELDQKPIAPTCLGKITLENTGKFIWPLSLIMVRQPHHKATISLLYKKLSDYGIIVNKGVIALGFAQETRSQSLRLVRDIKQKITHNRSIYVYFDTNVISEINDFNSERPIKAWIEICWGKNQSVRQEIEFNIKTSKKI